MRKVRITVAVVAMLATAACGKSKTTALDANTTVTTSTTAAEANAQVATATKPGLGTFLVDAKGMTLYRNTKEANGTIACTGQCLVNWPPFLKGQPSTTAGVGVIGQLATIVRPDGREQVTYNGFPLYHWIGDKQPGDASGQGVGGIWFVVAPDVTAAATAGSSSTTATTAKAAGTKATTTTAARGSTTTTMRSTTTTAHPATTTTTARAATTTSACPYPPCY